MLSNKYFEGLMFVVENEEENWQCRSTLIFFVNCNNWLHLKGGFVFFFGGGGIWRDIRIFVYTGLG